MKTLGVQVLLPMFIRSLVCVQVSDQYRRIHIPTYQSCSFCPGQKAAWAEKDVLRCVQGGTGAEMMGLCSLGLIGQSCSTC